MIVVADTSGLVAAFDNSEPEHEACRAVLTRDDLIVSPLVLTELDHLLNRKIGFAERNRVVDYLLASTAAGRARLAEIGLEDLTRAQSVRAAYSSLELDLTDGVGVVLADRYRTNQIFTLDQRDFRAVRPLGNRFDSFRLLPADAE